MSGSIRGTFRHYHSKTGFKVPVNVTMQEPGARIVGHPSDHHLLPNDPSADHITANGVHVIEGIAVGALYDTEGMPMKMYGMRSTWSIYCHRQLYYFVGLENVHTPVWEQLSSVSSPTKNLE